VELPPEKCGVPLPPGRADPQSQCHTRQLGKCRAQPVASDTVGLGASSPRGLITPGIQHRQAPRRACGSRPCAAARRGTGIRVRNALPWHSHGKTSPRSPPRRDPPAVTWKLPGAVKQHHGLALLLCAVACCPRVLSSAGSCLQAPPATALAASRSFCFQLDLAFPTTTRPRHPCSLQHPMLGARRRYIHARSSA